MAWWWGRPPQLHTTAHDGAEERKVGWLELFYDLIYVATIIQLGNLLSANVSPLGALLFVLLFIPVWWSWTGMMFYFNRFVADDIWHRLLVFAQMFAIANLAISVTGAFGDMSRDFSLAYFAIRVILVIFYVRAWSYAEEARPLIARYAGGFALAASIWLVSVFVPEPYRFGLWVLALLLEFSVPLSKGSRRLQSLLPPDRPHMAERYGLFTIIVLGESFIKVVDGLSGLGITLASLTFAGLGFAIIACFWWLYFDSIAGARLKPMPAAPYLWIYSHLPLTMGITAVGVGTKKLALLDFGSQLADEQRWLVCGAVALCLLSAAVLDHVTEGPAHMSSPLRVLVRLLAAVLVLLLDAFGGGMAPLLLVSLVTLTCLSQVCLDILTRPDERASGLDLPSDREPGRSETHQLD